MSQENKQYELFQEKRSKLLSLIRQHLKILNTLAINYWEDNLRKLEDRLLSERFRVLVLGEFKRGKSTFINALLREEILPAKAPPCTAIINEIKWGESPQALLHFLPSQDGSVKPPLEISVDKIADYVVIKTGLDHKDGIKESPYEKVELFWPLEICKNGVEIIDSPGLNEHEIRQKVTIDYLSTVDAILFVLSCEALASKSEIDVVNNNLRKIGHEEIFFICNRFDLIRRQERDELKQYGISKLAPLTNGGAERVFFISAVQALDGRLDGDEELVKKSGILSLEKELEKFLASHRGRIKILQPAREFKEAIYQARRTIPERKALLQTDFKTLESRYEAAQIPLKQLEKTRQNIVQRIYNFRLDMKELVKQKARQFYEEVTNKIEEKVQGYQVKEPFGIADLLPWQIQAAVERIVTEITEYVSSCIETDVTMWQESELQPFLENRLQGLMTELDTKASEFLKMADQVRLDLAVGNSLLTSDVEVDGAKISAIERIIAAAGGFLFGNFVTAGLGAMFGIKEMVKGIVTQIAIASIAVVLFGSNPFLIIPVLLAGGFIQGLLKMNATTDNIKKSVAKKYKQEFPALAYKQSDEIAEALEIKLTEIQNMIDQGLANEINNIEDQVESILKEKQKGQGNVEQKLQELELLSQELDKLDSELDELITQVALP